MTHIVNYEATLEFEVEGETFEVILEQIPGQKLDGTFLVNEFVKRLNENKIDFTLKDIPTLIASSIVKNDITFKVNDEPFFELKNSLSSNRKSNVVSYGDKSNKITGQSNDDVLKETKGIVDEFKQNLGKFIGRIVSDEEAASLMAYGGELEE